MGNILFENDLKKFVLIAGEPKSGKTTFLYKLWNFYNKKSNDMTTTLPTFGFNHEKITKNNIELNLIDFGGDINSNSIGYYFYKNIKVDYLVYIVDFKDFLNGTYSQWFINLNSIINDFEMCSAKIVIIINCRVNYNEEIQELNKKVKLHNSEINQNNTRINSYSYIKLNNKFFKENKKLGNLILYDNNIFHDQLIKDLFQSKFGNFKYTIINKEIEILFFNVLNPHQMNIYNEFINQFFN